MSGVLTPAVIASALEIYRSTGTFAGAARAVGVEESTVRKALRRHTAPERHELMADALDDAHEAALASVVIARQRTVDALQVAEDIRDVALCAHTLHEGLRAVTTARAAHGRLVLVAVQPESVDDDALCIKLERLSTEHLRLRIERLSEGLARDVLAMSADALAAAVADRVRALLARVAAGDSAAAGTLGQLFPEPCSGVR